MKSILDSYVGLYCLTEELKIMTLGSGSGRTSGKILKPFLRRGYPTVHLSKNGKYKNIFVHRIVAQELVSNPDPINKRFINHKDGNKLNYHPSNLEWCTSSENTRHGYQTGLIKPNNFTAVFDTATGIYYDSLKEACFARGLNRHRIATKIWRGKNDTSLVYV